MSIELPKCIDAYGPCNTSLHDDDAPLSVEHNAFTSDDVVCPFVDVYCILSYVKYAVSNIPSEEIAASCFRKLGFQHLSVCVSSITLSLDCDLRVVIVGCCWCRGNFEKVFIAFVSILQLLLDTDDDGDIKADTLQL